MQPLTFPSLQIAIHTLWNIRIVILAKPEHENRISHICTDNVKTGIANTLGEEQVWSCPKDWDLLSPRQYCSWNGTALSPQDSFDCRYVTLVLLKLYPTSTDYRLPCKNGNLFVCILSTYIFIFPANTFDWLLDCFSLGFTRKLHFFPFN